jgi:hypothetical protein
MKAFGWNKIMFRVLKYRKNLLTFREDDNLDPLRKEIFQLGRMVDILVCEKGDEILIRSKKNDILQNYGIPYYMIKHIQILE